MPLDTIEGKWTGEFKYDQGFPIAVQGRWISFTVELWISNNVINGIFIDDHTKHFDIGPATIIGTFEKNIIKFTKTYPYLLVIDETNNPVIIPGRPAIDVEYTGKLKKFLFSPGYYFKGKAGFSVMYKNKMGLEKTHTFWSVWSMKKAP